MRKIGRIIYFILMVLLPYSFIIYFYPIVGENIDDFTGTEINSNFRGKLVSLVEKMKDTKDSTNVLIDGVGSNTKNKTTEQNRLIDEIRKQ